MNPSLPALLQAHPVFMALSAPEQARWADAAIARRYQADEIVSLAGDCWPYLFLAASGRIVAAKESAEGRAFVVAEIGEGEIFWGVAFFQEGAANPVTLQCRSASLLYLWRREDVQDMLLANGRLAWELARLMVSRMLHASTVIESLAFQPVAGRLARLLLEQVPPDRQSARRALTLDEMAARLGTTREVVCRTLYRFADEKLIDVTRTEFILTDRAGLARLVTEA